MDMTPQTWPEWYDGRHINEVLFCQQFLEKHPMKCELLQLVRTAQKAPPCRRYEV